MSITFINSQFNQKIVLVTPQEKKQKNENGQRTAQWTHLKENGMEAVVWKRNRTKVHTIKENEYWKTAQTQMRK